MVRSRTWKIRHEGPVYWHGKPRGDGMMDVTLPAQDVIAKGDEICIYKHRIEKGDHVKKLFLPGVPHHELAKAGLGFMCEKHTLIAKKFG